MERNTKWSSNIIIADGDYVDRVAFNLTVNFERMLGRRIPQADLARWIDCIALDGGLREGDNDIQVMLIHDKGSSRMENFSPSSYDDELNGKAFKDQLGEFCIACQETAEIISKSQFLHDVVGAACIQPEVKRIMIIPDSEDGESYEHIAASLRHVEDKEKQITMFAMQPMMGGNFKQEILGFSLLSALGIRSEELQQ